ncbi:baseplate J/gp47 family protein [Acinetobacter sp. 243_ASPC]|uniref:baseplate J/gp47 family protein n=1 Tax=Acinetobacter sp. 243_ASPC TaxID=1579345 RepID=UPI0006616C80|nr:baseplate J/gp47 family protein [Acinetobacter sp. 243_ASPC]
MAYPIPSFNKIRNSILQEVRNQTGITVPDDSDAAIRADGETAVVEGLYQHQKWIERQRFLETADEPYLYIHAERLNAPRQGGTYASGSVTAISNVDMTITSDAKITNGKGYYWSVAGSVDVKANQFLSIQVAADQTGASWNMESGTLMWVAPAAGLQSTVTVVSITGGSDEEELEDWRERLKEIQELGYSRDRKSDFIASIRSISLVRDIYVYAKRRGLGTVDVAITAKGKPAMLPTDSLLASVQLLLDDVSGGFWSDCRAYSPTKEYVNIIATVAGTASKSDIEGVIEDYVDALAPGDTYQPTILLDRILTIDGVTDVELNTKSNITPTVNWQHTGWLRLGLLEVRLS